MTASDVHVPLTYSRLLTQALSGGGDRPAFVHRDRVVTYRQAERMLYAGARVLLRRGLQPAQGVACLSPNSPESWLMAMAAVVAGGRYTPVHPLAAAADVAAVVDDADVRFLLYDPSLASGLEHVDNTAVTVLALDDVLQEADAESSSPIVVSRSAEDLALLPYTGGTTGRPKGVMLSHAAFAQMTLTMLAGTELGWAPRVLLYTPLTHAAGTVVAPTLLRRGTVHLLDKFDPHEVVDTVERHEVTVTLGVPAVVYALVDAIPAGERRMPSLESLIYTAAPASPARLEEALDRLGAVLAQLYGQTEAPQTIAYLSRTDHLRDPGLLASCGQPMPGVTVALLDPDGDEVAPGDSGEICVRGPLVMSGYWQQPEATAETLRGGWLHTGDVARRDDDGYLYIVDRMKDLIITGGFNVFPREVEDTLAQHPAVAASAVIGVPSDKWGEAVTAFVVRRPGAETTAEELVSFVRERKGALMAPKTVEFRDALPLTPVGKADKVTLRAPYWSGHDRAVH